MRRVVRQAHAARSERVDVRRLDLDPKQPTSDHPMSSIRITTMFGHGRRRPAVVGHDGVDSACVRRWPPRAGNVMPRTSLRAAARSAGRRRLRERIHKGAGIACA
jgi:hypothetical protein